MVFYDFNALPNVCNILTEKRPRIVFCQESLQLVIAASTDGLWGCSQ